MIIDKRVILIAEWEQLVSKATLSAQDAKALHGFILLHSSELLVIIKTFDEQLRVARKALKFCDDKHYWAHGENVGESHKALLEIERLEKE